MSCNIVNKFGHVSHIGHSGPIKQMEYNLVHYLDNALLQIGAWTDIDYDAPNLLGADVSQLKSVCCVGYTDGQVWEGVRKNWVHENVTYTDTSGGTHTPLNIEVKVDSVVVPSGYSINYREGQIIFDTPISETSVVQARRSVKDIQVYIGDEAPWWKELQFHGYDVDIQQAGCGLWNIGAHHRVQLPAIILNAYMRGTKRALALGNYCIERQQVVKFHILSDDKCIRDNLVDTLIFQSDRCIKFFNIDDARIDGQIPLDCNGFLVGSKSYTDLLDDYPLGIARLSKSNMTGMMTYNFGLYEGVVSTEFALYWCI